MRTGRGIKASIVVVTLLIGSAAACGDATDDADDQARDDDTPAATSTPDASATDEVSTPTPTPTDAGSEPTRVEPRCDEVWVPGQPLPRPYKGCYDGTDWVPDDTIICSYGGKLVVFDKRFWAVPGQPVRAIEGGPRQDPDFQQALRACTA
jgi:hypothetical protein